MEQNAQPLTPEQLQAIRERESAVRNGKWYYHDSQSPVPYPDWEIYSDDGNEIAIGIKVPEHAAFIANARTDIPALLADRELLTARIEELEKKNSELLNSLQEATNDIEDLQARVNGYKP